MRWRNVLVRVVLPLFCIVSLVLTAIYVNASRADAYGNTGGKIDPVFDLAAKEYGVPAPLLKAICYMEGRMSDNGGSPSIDEGYGCMHLVKNKRVDTLDQAAKVLDASADKLKKDMTTNIRGGAAILRSDALKLSGNGNLPASLGDWYGSVELYSDATTSSTATMYADAIYTLLKQGFSVTAETGEIISLGPLSISVNIRAAHSIQAQVSSLPAGCVNDGKTDYPGAVDCIVNPKVFDCNAVSTNAPCTYESSNRPTSFPVNFVVIHDIEGTAQAGLNVFQDVQSGVSIHYIVDTDGTVYQLLHDNDIAYHAGNYWYNQRAVGVEHVGYDAKGYQWYNATQYLASARLVAYLLKKYNLPLDHNHVIGHSDVPAPALKYAPNHVDPGPYWLWTYYLQQVRNAMGTMPILPGSVTSGPNVFTIQPATDLKPANPNGTETTTNYNFFRLYMGPSTKSNLIPQASTSDNTDVTGDVETDLPYTYLSTVPDQAGSGATMYQVWFGETTHLHDSTPSYFANGRTAWLAVPRGAGLSAVGNVVSLSQSGSTTVKVYGRPTASDTYQIGDAPKGALFVSGLTTTDGSGNLWYEIDYNHRQAWVPATVIIMVKVSGRKY